MHLLTSCHQQGPKCRRWCCRYTAPPGKCYYNTLLLCCDYFSLLSVVSHAFSVLCVYSKFGHHPHPYATFVPNFISFTASIAKVHGEKIAYSIAHSITHPSYNLMPWEPKCRLCFGICLVLLYLTTFYHLWYIKDVQLSIIVKKRVLILISSQQNSHNK